MLHIVSEVSIVLTAASYRNFYIIFSYAYFCCGEITWPKATWGKNVFMWLILPHHFLLKDMRTGTESGKEPVHRSWCRGHGGGLLNDLLLMVHSACFLLEPRTRSRYIAPPLMGWTINRQLRKCPTAQLLEVLSHSMLLLSDDTNLC